MREVKWIKYITAPYHKKKKKKKKETDLVLAVFETKTQHLKDNNASDILIDFE